MSIPFRPQKIKTFGAGKVGDGKVGARKVGAGLTNNLFVTLLFVGIKLLNGSLSGIKMFQAQFD